MRAIDAIKYIADFYPDFDREKAMQMLDTFGLQPKQKIKSMSKGMQEKLQLILVMCRNAQLYIFDEPLSGALMIGQGKILLNSSVDDICSSGKTLEDVFKEVFKYAWQIN